jgi:hypothetical protein
LADFVWDFLLAKMKKCTFTYKQVSPPEQKRHFSVC